MSGAVPGYAVVQVAEICRRQYVSIDRVNFLLLSQEALLYPETIKFNLAERPTKTPVHTSMA